MKTLRKFQLAAIFTVCILSLNAQISVGVKTGVNFADTNMDGIITNLLPEQTVYPGFTAGLIAELPLKNGFSFRPELNYIQKGFVTQADIYDFELLGIDIPIGAKAKTRFNYIEMPLLFKYSIGNELAKVYFIGGPNVAYAANAHIRPVANLLVNINLPAVNLNLNDDIYQRWELSGTIGAGGELKAGAGKIFADVRYTHGFTNMLSNPIIEMKTKNQGFNLSAGYAYNF